VSQRPRSADTEAKEQDWFTFEFRLPPWDGFYAAIGEGAQWRA